VSDDVGRGRIRRVRTLGLLGGMSWESSIHYERLINERVRTALGGVHSADLVIRSYDFASIERLQRDGDWDAAGRLLAGDAVLLTYAGAQGIVLCTNTMHVVADAIASAVDVPLLHIADATAAAAHRAGVRRVGLLGTRFTMEQPFIVDRLTQAGLDVLVPDADDRALVHDVIYSELVRGVVRPESREAVVAVVTRLVDKGATGVIAGCTEIELLVRPHDLDVTLFPTTALHAEAAADFALGP
jgi:aspartate racemase